MIAFIILTYFAGVLTILSPCILPVLPFVFSKSQGSFAKNGFPLLLGMALTFSLFSGIAIVGGEWITRASEVGRILAMVLMALFGLSLIFPSVSETIFAPFARFGSTIGQDSKGDSPRGSFVIGISLGLLWAPCAGPILGLVLTGAATRATTATSIGLLFSYALGAATSLSVALVAGNRFLGSLKKFLGVDQVIKKVLGVAVLLGVVVIAFGLDRTVLTQISKVETMPLENKLLDFFGLRKEENPVYSMVLAEEGPLPDLSGAVAWINSNPLSATELRGKVVLIDFWTYSCINCLRTLPYVKDWATKYKSDGLVVIGVHTPEFAFEKSVGNVQTAVKDLGIEYPVAVDSNYKIWNAFKNQYWPAHYFVDRLGHIRHHHFGEGKYAESEQILKKLLGENGHQILAQNTEARGEGIQSSSSHVVKSPETYVGYARAKSFASTSKILEDKVATYHIPKSLALNQWALGGAWKVEAERAVSTAPSARVSFRFHARDLHLVLGSAQHPVSFQVTIDGHAPATSHGVDVDEQGKGTIREQRLYQLIRQPQDGADSEHTFEIEFSSPDAEVYAFTFG